MSQITTLHGRCALITGAGSGIGRAVALGFAASGADLVLLSDHDDLAPVAAQATESGVAVDCLQVDLSEVSARREAVRTVLQRHQVHILVNNAGQIRRAPAADFSDADWQEVFEVNLHAAFDLSRSVGSCMLERGSGKIVNIASMLSFQGGVNVASYAASKHALVGLTRALANEWAGRGVNVNALAPGYVSTAVTAALRADSERSKEILGRIPAGRWGEPADLVGPALFLASSSADYVHGHVLAVDGGWLSR